MRNIFSFILLCLLTACSNNKADIIIHHAVIYTVDSSFSTAEAMAIKDGLIVETGSNDFILKK